MRIGVIGLGVVGSAVKHGLERIGHVVFGFDIRQADTRFEDVLRTEVVFVCVPTPAKADGSCDVSIVEDVVAQIARADYKGVVAIKSTVPPGTTGQLATTHYQLRLAFCPEFLRERAAFVDFVERHDLCVIGTWRGDGEGAADFDVIARAHGTLPKHIVRMRPVEAELAKYFSNVFNALRIVFANEFFEVCRKVGADYHAIKAAMVHRDTIEDAYLDCNDNFRGFAGACLPKDTAAFAAFVRELGLDLKLFETIVDENKKFTATVPEGMRP